MRSLGLLAGLAFLDTTGLAIAIAVAAGGAAGGGLGFVDSAMVRMQQADAAELTYHDVENGGGDVMQEYRIVARTGRAAVVIDDVQPPWRPRAEQVRGSAEALSGGRYLGGSPRTPARSRRLPMPRVW